MLQIELSLQNHQKLVDIICEHSDKNGVCCLSNEQLAKLIGKSCLWVEQAIRRINQESPCLIRKIDGYHLIHTDITANGTFFNEVLNLIELFNTDAQFFSMNEKVLAYKLSIKRTTLQAAKAYYRDIIKHFMEYNGYVNNKKREP